MWMIDQALVDAFEQEVVRPITMIYIDWVDEPVYTHTGVGDIVYDGKVWKGVGDYGSIGKVTQDSNIGAHTLKMSISAFNYQVMNEVVLNNNINREVKAYTGAIGDNGKLIAVAPYFSGRVSDVAITRYSNDSIQVTATSKTADWKKSRSDRYTNESHLSRHPGDYFFQYVEEMAERDLWWGVKGKTTVPLESKKDL